MKQLHLIGVLVRLFALFWFAKTLQSFPLLFNDFQPWGDGLGNSPNWMAMIPAAVFVASLLAAALMWLFHLPVARLFFFANSGEKMLELSGAEHLESAVFAAAGLWLVLIGLTDGVYWLTFYLYARTNYSMGGEFFWTPENRANVAATAVEFLIGGFLLLRRDGVLALIRRLRGQAERVDGHNDTRDS